MLKMLKYLKPFTISVITVVVLLVVQAVCDLSLPDYTSNIVNVGIQQNGIENAVPKEIRKSELDKLMIFMTGSQRNLVEKSYSEKNGDKTIYELNTKDKETISDLNPIITKSIMKVSAIDMAAKEGKIQNLPQNVDVWSLLSDMPKDQLNNMEKEINKGLSSLDENMQEQAAINFVKNEYQEIGIDTDKLQTNYIFVAGAKMLGVAVISMLATVAVGYIASRIGAGMSRSIRSDVFKKVVEFSNVEFEKFSTASLITRSTNDVQQIQMFMVMFIRIVLYAPILGAGGVLKILNTDTSMAWIIGLALAAIITVVSVLFGLAIPKFKIVQKLVDKLNLVTRESLTGMLVIRAFSNQKIEEKKFDETNALLRKTNTFVNRVTSTMMPLMMLIMNIVTVLVVWVGAHQIDSGNMQVGDMMAFIQYSMQIIMSFLMITMLAVILPKASVSASRIHEVLTSDVAIKDPKEDKELNKDKKGYVEFKNVSFRYPDAENDVITNISFTAKPGETTAFIGSTGSGKSTLINLIPRFFDATDGEILVDGVNIKDISQHKLRNQIGYVPQKGILFSGTIESNIKYGSEGISDEDVVKAASIAQATEFIESKPEKYETEISQGGTNVSGGQKQRLSIARALAKKPDIFIFDDSFSALDLKTDAALRKELKSQVKDSTMLIVAQRISTIMNAEQIIVLDEGNMVGKGTHEELLKNCEVYKQIALSQLSKEEL